MLKAVPVASVLRSTRLMYSMLTPLLARHAHHRTARCALLAVVALAANGHRLAAQSSPWRTTIEANGNLLYGAASQRVVNALASLQGESPRRQFRAELQGGYGDARDQETRVRRMIVRNLRGSTSVDFTPRATASPFAFGVGESSLQQRLASRFSVGAGAKYTFWRPDSVRAGFLEDASVSVAMLSEQTRALARPGTDDQRGAGLRNRWSLRARYRARLGEAVRFSHLSFFQPTVDRPARYTAESSTTLAVPVRPQVEFTVTHRERLDSEARDRGAPSIRDGQLLFGVRAVF
jgi:hypothetical protein